MAKKAFWIGTTGPFYFDDAELQQDTGALLPAGTNQAAIITDGQLQVLTAPVLDTEVLRLEDVGVNTGDIVGPAGATDNAVARFDGATGKKLKNSSVTIDNSGSLNIPTGQGLQIAATQVVTNQQAAVADATGAGDVVAQLNDLLTKLRNHGLIVT